MPPTRQSTYLHTTFLLPAEFDFAELALTNGVTQNVLAEFGLFLAPRVIMPAPPAASRVIRGLGHGNHRRRCCLVILRVWGLVRLRQGEALLLPLNVDFGLRY